MAVELGFPHYILDIRSEFGEAIIENFVEEYLAGRTPNPCVLCNTHIKWDALVKRAEQLDCEFIATGHYARVRKEGQRYVVSAGLDVQKDQSYVLWGLSQSALAKTLFPIGGFKKTEIRELASKAGFERLSKKAESYEICFVPDNDYRSFLKRKVDGLETLDGGDFVLSDGTKIGKHHGYPFYTIGQRKGLEVAVGKPLFVLEIKPESNTVVLGEKEELNRTTMMVRNVNLVKYESLAPDFDALTKIRYKDKGTMSHLNSFPNNEMHVEFLSEVQGIAPGQSAVFYEGNDLIGGGFIKG
jgi:tRNA-specific 2-thiouridylase